MTQLIFKEGTNLPNMILQKKYNETFERRGNSIYVNFYNSKEGCRGTLIVDQSNVSIIPLQLLAYQTAKSLGCDIDKPRNLAKSVTVE